MNASSTTYALVGETLTPTGTARAAVVVKGGKIADVVEEPRPEDLPERHREVQGLICPGFVDLQINGAFGADIGPDPEALRSLAAGLPSTGVTSFLPTLISSPADLYDGFFAALEEAETTPGARILGAHLEGPFLASTRKGAHDPANIRPVDPGFLRYLLASGRVAVMTLAPELPGAAEAVGLLAEDGVVASAGHMEASYEQVVRAADAGLTMGTHLYNAMSPLKHRDPGAVGALLDDDRLVVGVIADGVHVHEGALRVAHKAKKRNGLALVTDAMEAAGMPQGDYRLGGRRAHLEDGTVRLPDGTLAGSALTMDRAVRNAVRFLGVPLAEAARLASEVPATALGLRRKGELSAGYDADLVVLDGEGFVRQTIVGGEVVYKHQDDGGTRSPEIPIENEAARGDSAT
jgi:N-acetylglucosamine-6-phosphate deacetylase